MAGGNYRLAAVKFGQLGLNGYKDSYERSLSAWQNVLRRKTLVIDNNYIVGLGVDGAIYKFWADNDGSHFSKIDSTFKNAAYLFDVGQLEIAAILDDGTVCSVGYIPSTELNSWKDVVYLAGGGTTIGGTTTIIGIRIDGSIVYDCSYSTASAAKDEMSAWRDIVDVAVGTSFVVGVKADGTVVAVGTDMDQTGSGNKYHNTESDYYKDWTDIVQITTDGLSVYGLRKNGTVIKSEYVSDKEQKNVVYEWEDVKAIEGFNYSVIGIKSDGSIVTDASEEISSVVTEWHDIVMVDGGNHEVIAVDKSGNIYFARGKYSWDDYDEFDAAKWGKIKVPNELLK